MPIRPSGGQSGGMDPFANPDEYARARGFKNAAEAHRLGWVHPQPPTPPAPQNQGVGGILNAVRNLPGTMFPPSVNIPNQLPQGLPALGNDIAGGLRQQMGDMGAAMGQVGGAIGGTVQQVGGAVKQIGNQLPTFGPPAPTSRPSAPPTPPAQPPVQRINLNPPLPVTYGPQQPGIQTNMNQGGLGQYGQALGQFGKSLGRV